MCTGDKRRLALGSQGPVEEEEILLMGRGGGPCVASDIWPGSRSAGRNVTGRDGTWGEREGRTDKRKQMKEYSGKNRRAPATGSGGIHRRTLEAR